MPLVRMDQVEPEEIVWLWDSWFPRGKLVLIDGDGGIGKSTLLLDLAARLSAAATMPDGQSVSEPMSSLFLSVEDGLADTIQPRLTNAGADLSRVFALPTITATDDRDGSTYERLPSFPDDAAFLAQTIERLPQPIGLVVIDPVFAFLGAEINGHKDQDTRRALSPLVVIAEQTGATIVLVRHLNKSNGPANQRGGGSVAFLNTARIALLAGRDPQRDDSFVLLRNKGNLGRPPQALTYGLLDGGNQHPRVVWGPACDLTADQLVTRQETASSSEDSAATATLREILQCGPVGAKQARQEMREAGFSEYSTRAAKQALGVTTTKRPAADGAWEWALPAAKVEAVELS